MSASNGGTAQAGAADVGTRLLSEEALAQRLVEWCPDLEDGPPELVCSCPPEVACSAVAISPERQIRCCRGICIPTG